MVTALFCSVKSAFSTISAEKSFSQYHKLCGDPQRCNKNIPYCNLFFFKRPKVPDKMYLSAETWQWRTVGKFHWKTVDVSFSHLFWWSAFSHMKHYGVWSVYPTQPAWTNNDWKDWSKCCYFTCAVFFPPKHLLYQVWSEKLDETKFSPEVESIPTYSARETSRRQRGPDTPLESTDVRGTVHIGSM